MKKVLKNYKSSVILLCSILLGAVLGLVFGEDISVISPLGDLFLNLLLVTVVPLIFLSITSSIAKMKQPKRLGKILVSTLIIFIITSVVAVLISFFATNVTSLVNKGDAALISETFDYTLEDGGTELNLLERTVDMLSVNDFILLFSKDNVLQLIVFSCLIGIAVNMSKEKGKKFAELLDSGMEVILSFIKIIMLYAPIGLCAYFATLVGTFGSVIAVGYLKTFILYLVVSGVLFFGVYSLYAFISAGKNGVKSFWKNIIPSTLTALATCSSAASIPVNIECTKKIGVPKDIAETTVSLGTSFHKDGSTIGSVFKIMFLVSLFGTNISTFGATMEVLGIALLATLLVSAVPIGGGTISEMLIITMMGYPVAALPILTIIATVIDAPATVLNVVGDSSSAMLISRSVEGKNWFKKKN